MEKLPERLEIVLGAMASGGPRNLRAYIAQPGPDFERADDDEIDRLISLCLSSDPNNPSRLRFSNVLRSWDNTKEASWTLDTTRNTEARRKRIHEQLRSTVELQSQVDTLLPFFHLDEPLIIASTHQDWYAPKVGVRDYYWSTYTRYLTERRGWDEDSVLSMDNATLAILECLANPESRESYSSRGLVMGYVQSGKTSNFMGVAARAADAGYRLLIVLAGTWNILRNQTQRRFDKELLGKELLKNDESYSLREPADWDEFLTHGAEPATLGFYTWQRLTRPDIDFKRLRESIDNLEYEKREKALPLYHATNLHALPVKLLVVKKHSGILANLVRDFKLVRTNLKDLPTLIIDDESDQAGLNTVDPKRSPEKGSERSKTNQRMVELLRLFPRGQYIGYTATPYANALVDPDDPEDLFPKDFIVSLDRPRGYMGVGDFFDPTEVYEDLRKDDYSQPEIAYIRRVESPLGADDEDLKMALRSYALSGGLKLFRHGNDPKRYRIEHFKHHTMLIHTSQRKGEHASLAERLTELWNRCALNSPKGLSDLEKVWNQDYAKVCSAMGNESIPESFSDLIPYLSEAIKRIDEGQQVFLVVNSDSSEAPDFGAAPVWKIIVGGNKLSRGYTIEGLTVSYYRRVAGTADTLMQMGRWFGFRPGYQDLVRVFLGVKDGRRADTDLVALFKEVCRMEERFRAEVQRYVRAPGSKRITPKEVPPLVAVSGSLPPTARNKMFNAVLASKNFGGQWSMLTLSPCKTEALNENIAAMEALLTNATQIGKEIVGGTNGKGNVTLEALIHEVSNVQLLAFLKGYHWLEADYEYPERPADTNLQIEFLENQKHGIISWLLISPQRKSSFGSPLLIKDVGQFAVKNRKRIAGRGFQVFGEPTHRDIGKFLTGLESEILIPNEATKALKNEHRGICLLYPVRENEQAKISIGFELLFPKNNLGFDMNFTVRRKSESSRIIVSSLDGR